MVIALAIFAGNLFAGGFALTGVGSRATAMGGAFRGLSDDASAMYWNPAGLGFMNETSIALGGTFILPIAKWDPSGTPVASIPGFKSGENEAEKSLRAFPNVLFVKAKESRFKYGIGVFVPYGLGTTWDAYDLPAAYTYEPGFPEEEMLSSIAIFDIHPTVAYQIMPNLSAGIGISAMYGTIDISKFSYSTAFNLPSPYIGPISTELSGSGFGIGANMGIMYKASPDLSIGLSGKIPSQMQMSGDAEVYFWKPDLGENNPAAKLGKKCDIDADLKLPGEVGIGLAYKVKPNWTLSLDYAYTMWDRLDKVVVEFKDPHPLIAGDKSELAFDWENTSRISLGTEYNYNGNMLRAGFFMDQSPIPEETQTPTLSDISTKYSTNLGWGRDFGNYVVDANVQYIYFPEREVKTASANNLLGKYNSVSMSGNIGIGYKF